MPLLLCVGGRVVASVGQPKTEEAVVQLRTMTQEDVAEAGRIFRASLGESAPAEPERYAHYWDVERSLVAQGDDGRLLGVAATCPSELTAVGGVALPCYVVPSVGVRADAHGRGVGRALLERQVADAVANGDAVMALNASETWIYGRFGYGPTSAWWSVDLDTRLLRWRDDAPRATPGSISEITPEEAQQLLPALHRRAFGRWGGELSRGANMWWVAFTPRKGKELPLFAVLRDDAGEVVAAAAYTVKIGFDDTGFANTLELVDLFGVDERAEGVLVRWLLERNLVGRFKAERFNPRSVIRAMLTDERRWRTTVNADAAWVRVLDVARVVAARTTLASGTVVLEVRDPLVPGNDGRWRITGDGDRLTCEPTTEAAQLSADVQLLAPMLWGYQRASALALAGRLEVADESALPALDALLAVTAPSWCSVGF